MLTPGGARAVARCRMLARAPYSDIDGGLFRAYLTPAYRAAQAELRGWMEAAGMTVREDEAANLVGRYEGSEAEVPALVIGSHLDSVYDGGCFDGPLGVMLGVELVARLAAEGRRLPFPIEVYAFGDEEGSRFPRAMLTSRAVAGILDPADLALTDDAGISLADEGIDIGRFARAARAPGSTLAYFEAHIEQGPLLEAEDRAVGTVTGIVSQRRYRLTVTGTAGHAGTVPMRHRRDALAGAAEMILAIERHAREQQADLVATVGQVAARPGATNVIPGLAQFTLDIRSLDEALRNRRCEAILADCRAIAQARRLGLEAELMLDLPASPCDRALMQLLDQSLVDNGQSLRRMVSGAGHDAMNFVDHCPVAMLFIRCAGGISHNPAEDVTGEDAEVALKVMRSFVEKLGDSLV